MHINSAAPSYLESGNRVHFSPSDVRVFPNISRFAKCKSESDIARLGGLSKGALRVRSSAFQLAGLPPQVMR